MWSVFELSVHHVRTQRSTEEEKCKKGNPWLKS